jgi:hypothetical protein
VGLHLDDSQVCRLLNKEQAARPPVAANVRRKSKDDHAKQVDWAEKHWDLPTPRMQRDDVLRDFCRKVNGVLSDQTPETKSLDPKVINVLKDKIIQAGEEDTFKFAGKGPRDDGWSNSVNSLLGKSNTWAKAADCDEAKKAENTARTRKCARLHKGSVDCEPFLVGAFVLFTTCVSNAVNRC